MKSLTVLITLLFLSIGISQAAPNINQFKQPHLPKLYKIKCPLGKVRTQIVTPIRSPWWQTPQIGSLKKTRIQTIGGKKTLVCLYWAYGDLVGVMRLPPRGTICRPRRGGFVCRRAFR